MLLTFNIFPLGVNILAGRLVEQWLKIVKDEAVPDKEIVPTSVVQIEEPVTTVLTQTTITEPLTEVTLDTSTTEKELNTSVEIPPQTFYKVTVRDGKQVIHKIETDKVDGLEANHVNDETDTTQVQTEVKEKKEITEKKSTSSSNKDRSKHDKSKHRSSSSSSSSKSSHSHSSSNKEKTSSSSSGSNSSSTSSNKDKHRDRSRDKKHRERDREHRSNGSVKSSSSSNIKDKEKQAEKDKATLAKIQPQSVDKLGKIPKKSSSTNDKDKSKNDKKDSAHKTKPSISIEVRKKTDGERPKTVKVFNSKLRSTGLEEAPKPPPSRQSVTKKTPTLPSVMPVKRPSPSREAPPPPEKKIKLPDSEEKQDKVGGIKLIPPKPKRKYSYVNTLFSYQDCFSDILEDNGTTGFVSFTSRWINEEQHLIQQFVKKQQPKALSTFIRPRVWILYFIIWSMMISVLFVYLPKLLFKFCGQHLSFIFKTDIKSDVPLWKICL